MTRDAREGIVWQWRCDVCQQPFGPVAVRDRDLPGYGEMIAAGWSIGRTYGDACPDCVAAGKTPAFPRHSAMDNPAAHATTPAGQLVALSRWIDAGNDHRDPESVTWGRVSKIAEELGEVISAFIGATGQNPRKGVTGDMGDVMDELLDVAITALGAYEHLDGHRGQSITDLENKIGRVLTRALASTKQAT